MNLLAYASGNYLDHLGALFGVTRLEATYATCTLEITLSAPLHHSIDIPIGTRITPDGNIYFATTELVRIMAGLTSGESVIRCETPGIAGNDFIPGQICKLVDPFPYEMTVRNVTASSGGEDAESDEAFRERIQIAPESFTNAGSTKGYEYFALSADPNIADVSVVTPPITQPGNVNIYVLMNGGALPDDDMLAKVLAVCSADDIRPDTDYVHVLRPEMVNYSVEVNYWIDAADSVQSETIQSNVAETVAAWCEWQGAKIGRDINPSQLHHDIIAAGAKRCEIISPSFAVLDSSQVACCISPSIITFKGLE